MWTTAAIPLSLYVYHIAGLDVDLIWVIIKAASLVYRLRMLSLAVAHSTASLAVECATARQSTRTGLSS